MLASAEQAIKSLQKERQRNKESAMLILQKLLGIEGDNQSTSNQEIIQPIGGADNQEKAEGIKTSKRKRRYKCDSCNYFSFYFGDLKKHKADDHQQGKALEGKYSCNACAFKSNSQDKLKQHRERVHEEKKRYTCECGYGAYHRYHILRHQQLSGCKARELNS